MKNFMQKEQLIWGPIFLCISLALAGKIAIPYDMLLLALGGFFLSARLKFRGLCYALILLSFAAIVKHAFFTHDHLWQLGIEGSIGLSFLITAFSFEEKASQIQALESQMEIQAASLQNLEEDLSKAQELSQEQQIIFQEKVAQGQKELEEIQTEYSSILILNEVLRKTTARHIQEAEEAKMASYNANINNEQLKRECEQYIEELKKLKNSDPILLENRQLMEEINQARYDKEQTHLINETLARLHVREVFKAKDAIDEAHSLKSQLRAAHQEIQRIAEPLEEKLKAASQQIDGLKFEFDKSEQFTIQARKELLKLHEIQTERNFLKERLDAAMLELGQQRTKVDPQLVEKLKFAEEKMFHLSQVEPLFKQLKQQFEEKNQILHETRSDLFKSKTELEKLQIEKSALELNPLPKEMVEELASLADQVEALEEENRELQELITTLSNSPERKKKVKTQPASDNQTLLF